MQKARRGEGVVTGRGAEGCVGKMESVGQPETVNQIPGPFRGL